MVSAGARLRLRRRARRHRAGRASGRVQPDVRRVRAAGALERGGVRPEAEDRRRQGADAQPAHARVRGGRRTCRRTPTSSSRWSAGGTSARPRSTPRWPPRESFPVGPAYDAWSVRRRTRAGGLPSPRPRPSRPCGRCSNTSSGQTTAAGFLVFAGDVVPRKKPAPDIYLLALEHLGLPASDAVVIEDSGNGLDAARAAGITCLVTVNEYTRDDDFDAAALVVSSLGDPDGERPQVLANASGVPVGDWVTHRERWRPWCPEAVRHPTVRSQRREIPWPQRFPTSSASSE